MTIEMSRERAKDVKRRSRLVRLDYPRSFEQEKSDATDYLLSWGEGGCSGEIDLELFQSCICIKNSQSIVVHTNSSFRDMIAGGRNPTGSRTDGYLSANFDKISQATDKLIIGGVKSIELEHIGHDTASQQSMFVTFKRRLDELRDPNLCFVVIVRPISVEPRTPLQRRRTLSEQLVVYHDLDRTDQTICQMYYCGESTKTIAAVVGFTTRSIEIRRQKILDAFGFQRPVEIIKLLVRLEEHALIRLAPSSSKPEE